MKEEGKIVREYKYFVSYISLLCYDVNIRKVIFFLLKSKWFLINIFIGFV